MWWKGKEINRHSQEYQNLLLNAYRELAKNTGFRKALLATGKSSLTHTIGKKDPSHTILTEKEFCNILEHIRNNFYKDSDGG